MRQRPGLSASDSPNKRSSAGSLSLLGSGPGGILQRLQAIKDQEGALPSSSAKRSPFAETAGEGVWIAEPLQSGIDELVRGSLCLRPLAIERPTVDAPSTAVAFLRHAPKPVLDQGRLTDAAPRDETEHISRWVEPNTFSCSSSISRPNRYSLVFGSLVVDTFGRCLEPGARSILFFVSLARCRRISFAISARSTPI